MSKRNSLDAKDFTPILDPELERSHLENVKYAEQWQICCSKSDPEGLKYIVQLGVGIIVLVFSMIQICVADHDQDVSIYFSLISMIVGVFLPSPKFVQNED